MKHCNRLEKKEFRKESAERGREDSKGKEMKVVFFEYPVKIDGLAGGRGIMLQ